MGLSLNKNWEIASNLRIMTKHDSLPTRGSLLARIKDLENDAAWKEFYDSYGGLVQRLALKAGLTESESEEVVQEVFISVTRNIGGFAYEPSKCSFKHWLSQMVRWRIRDQFAKRIPINPGFPSEPSGEEPELLGESAGTSESELDAVWEAEWKRHLIDRAGARVKKQVNAKHFQIYFLHVIEEMPTAEVVRRLKVSRTQVYLAKLRVGRLFQKELRDCQFEAEVSGSRALRG
jgi:RNA polymerase sigma-70 factor, ECF subfamily